MEAQVKPPNNSPRLSPQEIEKSRKEAAIKERSPVAEALRQQIIDIATKGDEAKDGAFTPNIASQIERIMRAGREILLVESLPLGGLKSLMKGKRRRGGGMMNGVYGPNAMATSLTDLDDMGIMDGGVMGPDILDSQMGVNPYGGGMNNPENFGVQSIRQLIDGLAQMNSDPVKDVRALAIAREKGLDDVAKSLEAKLGITTALKSQADKEMDAALDAEPSDELDLPSTENMTAAQSVAGGETP